ncbi:MAG TPA: biotin/lipoyl-binding protein [Steroidobacteraceae bacterium]|nr:biotin/lipoyl-binding protein [Steroidobacteraceae bacterium]
MRSRIIFIVSGMGLAFALVSAFISGQQPKALAPAFNPAANPYAKGIYANGIIESVQAQGQNINIYPEVAGPITQVLVAEGAKVHKGDLLLTIDDTVQRATTEQQQSQADAAKALLEELRAEPRRETLAVATAQVDNALATLKNAQDQLAKQEQSYAIEAKSVSRDTLDNARNAEKIAATNLAVVQKQYSLIKAGAWVYDIRNQERQYAALSKAYSASAALLDKYSMKAPSDGVVRSIQATVGSYASTQGVYDTYTGGLNPLIVMSTPDENLQVRVYVDEILIHRLADTAKMSAEMFVRGTNLHVPLTFTRIQPYVSPKIELADGRRERVDLRVLPLIFRFAQTKALNLYPGQLVDVYVSAN